MGGILLIDAEQPFASQMVSALEGRGFSVKHLDDGKDGLDYARDNRPDLIVLCVELPKMSGYSICNKLKKDNDLKGIPLIITSKEATPETFAQHKKLKTRAEDYLIKPFSESDLVEKIGGLITLPAGGAAAGGNGVAAGDDDGFAALDSLGADDAGGGSSGVDSLGADDFKLDDMSLGGLDEAAASTSGSGGSSGLDADEEAMLAGLDDLGGGEKAEEAMSLDSLDLEPEGGGTDDFDLGEKVQDDSLAGFDAALDSLQPIEEEPAPAPAPKPEPRAAEAPRREERSRPPEPAAPSMSAADAAEMSKLRRETGDLKAKVVELETKLKAADEAAKAAQAQLSQSTSSSSSGAREVLNLKEQLRAKEKEIGALKDEVFEKEKAVVEVQEELDRARAEHQSAATSIAQKDAEIASLHAKVEAVTEQRDELEEKVQTQLAAAEQERDRLRGELDDARADLDSARSDLEAARAEVQRLKSDLERAKGDVEDAKKMMAAQKAQADEKIRDLEGEARNHEERYLKAYQRLKADEAVREKAKKAVEIAFTLLNGEVESKSDLDLDQIDA